MINYLSSGLFPFRFYTLVQFVWVLKGILLRRVEDLNTRESGPEAPFSLSTVVYTSMSRIDPVKIKNVDFLDFLFLGHGEFVNLWMATICWNFMKGDSPHRTQRDSADVSFHCYYIRGIGYIFKWNCLFVYYRSASSASYPYWLWHPCESYSNGKNRIHNLRVGILRIISPFIGCS